MNVQTAAKTPRLQASENRAAFPEAAKLIAKFRETFPGAKVLYVEENGRSMGKRLDERMNARE